MIAALAGCGTEAPSNASQLTRACRVPPAGASYDWAYATVDRTGVVTGVAECSTDGTVASWAVRPSGSGDHVVLYQRGISGP